MPDAAVCARDARAHLERERDRVNEEIRRYAGPIPACDVYFNSLIEERGRLNDALKRLEETATGGET